MMIDLDTLAENFSTGSVNAADMLSKLQTNILKGHGRAFAQHVFLRFAAPSDEVKNWIRTVIAPLVQPAISQFIDRGGEDGGLVTGFYLTATGYQSLGFSKKKLQAFESKSFRQGMQEAGSGEKDPDPKTWEPWSQGEIHALITFADDDKTNTINAVSNLRIGSAGIVDVLHEQSGNRLLREGKDVEHFGYRDGVSQPLFTQEQISKFKAKNPDHNFDRWNPSAPLGLVLLDDPLTEVPNAFGSYLVYRKLSQDLDFFDEQVSSLRDSLKLDEDKEELAGALAVGRFRDGTPVVAHDKEKDVDHNDFDFSHDDNSGAKCPVHAHIRKVNPRGAASALAREKTRRIVRRGIPYGPPIGMHVADSPAHDPDSQLDRGLLFLCFQSDIDHQFEFLQRTWVDNPLFPNPISNPSNPTLHEVGDDPLIGQDKNTNTRAGQHWPKRWGDPGAGTTQFNFQSAVTLRGGEYFFAPSLPFLSSL